MAGKYSDLIDLPRPASRHSAMSMADRAAQFGSFAALSGFEQAIEETARRHIQAQDAAGKEPADAEPDLYCDRP